MSARAKWIALRLAFAAGFAAFAFAMFDVLPKIFLVIGFGLYCIAIPFWLYPEERLFPSDKSDASNAWLEAMDTTLECPPAEIDRTSSEAGAANFHAEHRQRPRPNPGIDQRPHHPGRLQMTFVAMVAARLAHHRWRGG